MRCLFYATGLRDIRTFAEALDPSVHHLEVSFSSRPRCETLVEQDDRTVKKRVWLARLRLIPKCLANFARYRNGGHDSEGESKVAGPREMPWGKRTSLPSPSASPA
jgi:hypothetical protein